MGWLSPKMIHKTLELQYNKKHYLQLRNKTIGAGILALPVVIIGMFFMDMPYGNWIMMGLTAPVLFWFGRSFLSMPLNRPGTAKPIWIPWWR